MSQSSLSIAQHYHERTKYSPETLGGKNKQLDWEQQPVPFKDYKIGVSFDLKVYLKDSISTSNPSPETRKWQRLSHLLFCSYGLTAKILTFGGVHYLRTAPSAGGLYPAEIYLISRGGDILPPGLYNYQPLTHSLLQFWQNDVWSKLQSACFFHPILAETDLVIALSAVFFRSAWRYEDRAYRRIFLDTGHLLGNIELAASLNHYRAHLIGGFADQSLNELLYLDSEKEGVISLVGLTDQSANLNPFPQMLTALPSPITTDYPSIPDGELLSYLHQATVIENPPENLQWFVLEDKNPPEDQYNFPFCSKVSTLSSPIHWGVNLEGLENTILKRRSTRAYTGESLTLEELRALLDFTYQSHHYLDQGLEGKPDYFTPDFIETFIAVSDVTGLEEGCYYYAPKAQELRQIRFKNFRRELHFLCLGQDLGKDAPVIIFHTADLQKAISKYGDRVYRYLHFDAGHLGQRLNLAAIYLGLGVSGIGGFFDDQVNEVLGIPPDEAVLYITTLGRPLSP